jgi:hypothetical protein
MSLCFKRGQAVALIAAILAFQAAFATSAGAQFIRKHAASELRGFHNNGPVPRITRSFQSDAVARKEFERILSSVGLNWISDRIEIRASAEIANAAAGIAQDGSRFIFYNAEFMQKVRQRTADHWSLISILAHEVGHHLAFHNEIKGRWHEFELEADYFSGFVLRRLGAPLAQASAAMRVISPEQATKTHPGLKDRIQAITIGWTDGGGSGPPRGLKNPDAANAGDRVAVGRSTQPSPPETKVAVNSAAPVDATRSDDPETRMRAILATNDDKRINREIRGFLGANKSQIRGLGLKAYFLRNRRFKVAFEYPNWLKKEVAIAERTGKWERVNSKAGSLINMHKASGGVLVFEHDLDDLLSEEAKGWSIVGERDDFYSGKIGFGRVGLHFRMRLAVEPRASCSFRFTFSNGALAGRGTCTRVNGQPPFAIFSAQVLLD